jgi:hypothetical protein
VGVDAVDGCTAGFEEHIGDPEPALMWTALSLASDHWRCGTPLPGVSWEEPTFNVYIAGGMCLQENHSK